MDCVPTDARIICTKRIVRYEVNSELDEDGVFVTRPSMTKQVIREEEMLYKIVPIPTFDKLEFVKMDGEEYRVETIRYNADDDINEVLVDKVVVEHENKEEAEKELAAKDKVWSKQCFAMDPVATMFVNLIGKQVGRMSYAEVSAFLNELKSYGPSCRQANYRYDRVNYSQDRVKNIDGLIRDEGDWGEWSKSLPRLAAGRKVNHNHSFH